MTDLRLASKFTVKTGSNRFQRSTQAIYKLHMIWTSTAVIKIHCTRVPRWDGQLGIISADIDRVYMYNAACMELVGCSVYRTVPTNLRRKWKTLSAETSCVVRHCAVCIHCGATVLALSKRRHVPTEIGTRVVNNTHKRSVFHVHGSKARAPKRSLLGAMYTFPLCRSGF